MTDGGPYHPTDLGMQTNGASLRDEFAKAAMAAILSNEVVMQDVFRAIREGSDPSDHVARSVHRVVAKRAYMLADAMLNERAK